MIYKILYDINVMSCDPQSALCNKSYCVERDLKSYIVLPHAVSADWNTPCYNEVALEMKSR